jgi:DNA invertase Pin-like site-specific DNA recombinase
MKPTPTRTLRCAIYTRVSTDQGLEQEFNSLDAQREAAQAYVKSQAHEGWRLIRDRYDDGGFSGGSMERPALQKLLADVKQRRIDTIVVYKVDRLTRSLADFAKLVELFDEYGVSFVSVTQSFNTTTSMGRLTLNVLLSFAQFEREVTGERCGRALTNQRSRALLLGKLYDDRGNRMTPSYAVKKGVRYRYYVSCVLAQGRRGEAGSVSRVAANEIEAIIAGALETRVPGFEWVVESSRRESGGHQDHHIEKALTVAEGLGNPGLTGPLTSRTAIEKHIDRIILRAQSVEIQWTDEPMNSEFADGAQPNSIVVAWRPTAFRRKRELMQPAEAARPIRAEARGKLLGYIAKGASWLEEILSEPAAKIETIAARHGLHERSARSILSLAFLAPDIVKGALAGTLPRGFGVSRLIDLPANWAEQLIALGLPTRS